MQQARNLALDIGERFKDAKFPIRDRGPDFTSSFDAVFQAARTTTDLSPEVLDAMLQGLVEQSVYLVMRSELGVEQASDAVTSFPGRSRTRPRRNAVSSMSCPMPRIRKVHPAPEPGDLVPCKLTRAG